MHYILLVVVFFLSMLSMVVVQTVLSHRSTGVFNPIAIVVGACITFIVYYFSNPHC